MQRSSAPSKDPPALRHFSFALELFAAHGRGTGAADDLVDEVTSLQARFARFSGGDTMCNRQLDPRRAEIGDEDYVVSFEDLKVSPWRVSYCTEVCVIELCALPDPEKGIVAAKSTFTAGYPNRSVATENAIRWDFR